MKQVGVVVNLYMYCGCSRFKTTPDKWLIWLKLFVKCMSLKG